MPATSHRDAMNKRVVEEVVVGSDAEERRWHAGQVRVERRDVRGAPLFLGHARQEEVEGEPAAVENVGARCDANAALAGSARQVVRAEHEVRTEEAINGIVLVPHAEQRHGSEMRAGRLTGDEQPVRAELVPRVLEQPARGRLAVVGSCRVRVLRREPIVDAHDGDIASVDEHLVEQVHHLGRTRHPCTAVDVEQHAVGLRRS